MLRQVIIVLFLSLILVAVASAQTAEQDTSESWEIEWINSIDSAQSLAASQNRLILLDFYSDT